MDGGFCNSKSKFCSPFRFGSARALISIGQLDSTRLWFGDWTKLQFLNCKIRNIRRLLQFRNKFFASGAVRLVLFGIRSGSANWILHGSGSWAGFRCWLTFDFELQNSQFMATFAIQNEIFTIWMLLGPRSGLLESFVLRSMFGGVSLFRPRPLGFLFRHGFGPDPGYSGATQFHRPVQNMQRVSGSSSVPRAPPAYSRAAPFHRSSSMLVVTHNLVAGHRQGGIGEHLGKNKEFFIRSPAREDGMPIRGGK